MAFAPRRWGYQLCIAVDQLVNVLLTPMQSGAYADETLSSRCWRMDQAGKPWGRVMRPVVDALFRWQSPNHCEAAYINERQRSHMPPAFRDEVAG
jgi:hypothetical protein